MKEIAEPKEKHMTKNIKMHIIIPNQKAKDAKEVEELLTKNIGITIAQARIGINRGQFFVRIPMAISQRLNLTLENQLEFIVEGNKEHMETKIKVVKNV